VIQCSSFPVLVRKFFISLKAENQNLIFTTQRI